MARLSEEALRRLIEVTEGRNLVPRGNELLGGNEGERRTTSSMFGELFEALSRPVRASAGAAYAATDKDPTTDPMKEAWRGLSGHGDKSYSDVLHNVAPGLPGWAKATGGFAGDVLLDPLTYVGVRNVKGTSLGEARIRAVKGLTGPVNEDTVEAAARELAASDPSHSYVTWAGRKISPSFSQPAKVGNVVKDKVLGPEEQRKLPARLFSRKSELPFGLAEMSRVYEARNAAIFEPHQRHIKEFWGRLTPEQRRQVTLGIEKGEDLSAVKLIGEEASQGGRFSSLEDYKKVAQIEMKRFFDEEAALGLYKPEQYNPNYVVKHFRKGVPESMPGLPAGARTKAGGRVDPLTVAKKQSLEEAERAGLDPITDIVEMMTMRAAKHYRTVGRQAFVRDAIEKFGVEASPENLKFLERNKWQRVEGGLNAAVSNADDLKDKWLPEPILRSINGTEQVLADGQIGGEFARWYDRTLNMWKKLNTSYNPGYHVRNSMSDGIINYMDGVTNPSLYKRSLQTIRSMGQLDAEDLLGHGISPVDPKLPRIRIKGAEITTKELWDLYVRAGSKSGMITSEFGPSLNPLAKEGVARYVDESKKLVTGGLRDFDQGIQHFSDKREDMFRLAHQIKAMEDNLPNNFASLDRNARHKLLEDAAMEAGKRVRKFNIDYGQLSTAERNVMRRIIPFYGWMRRNLPLQVEMLFTKPGFMATYPKGQDLFQGLLGSDDGSGDYMVSKWIRDSGPVRLAEAKNEDNQAQKWIKMLAGAGEGESVFTQIASSQTPIGDLKTLLDPVAKGIETGSPVEGVKEGFNEVLNMASPLIKAPVELGTGRSTFTGQKIDRWDEWAASQLGPTRTLSNVKAGDPRYAVSWLAGIGLQPTTAARQEGEWRRREDVLQSMINRRQAAGVAKRGIEDPTDDQLNKFKDKEIRQMQRYIKRTNQIMGSLNPE